jgi:hypothetical protein
MSWQDIAGLSDPIVRNLDRLVQELGESGLGHLVVLDDERPES